MSPRSRNVKRWFYLGLATLAAIKIVSFDESWWTAMLEQLQYLDIESASSFSTSQVDHTDERIETRWRSPTYRRLELPELAGSYQQNRTCAPPLVLYNDTLVDDDIVFENRKIPRMVHFTSKSRCLSTSFANNLVRWHFPNHSVYLHDDEAVERLLARHWPQFPHLQTSASCLLSGAAKADLWRGVVLYEYGGIYSDIDNYPNEFHADTIQPDDEAFFVVESVGVLSQWFFAARPKHPLMYLLVQTTLNMLTKLPHVDKQDVPRTTGPGALKIAMMHFMDAVRLSKYQEMSPYEKFQRIQAGLYTGIDNATVRVVGRKQRQNQFVCRNCVKTKRQGYAEMDMKHFSAVKPRGNPESCLMRFYRIHEKDKDEDW